MSPVKRRDFVKLGAVFFGLGGGRAIGAAPSGATVRPAETRQPEPVFLIATHIAGTTHISNIDRLAAGIDVGDRLELHREPANPYDDLAILVLSPASLKAGYVPRKDNTVLARLMAAAIDSEQWWTRRSFWAAGIASTSAST